MVYSFSELSEDAKQNAINWYLNSVEIEYGWWEHISDSIKTIHNLCGIEVEINGFDLGRADYLELSATAEAVDVIEAIKSGKVKEEFPTIELPELPEINRHFYKILETGDITSKYYGKYATDEKITYGFNGYPNIMSESEEIAEYLNDLLYELRNIGLEWLRNEWDYLTGDEAAAEAMKANDYYFTEDGDFYE